MSRRALGLVAILLVAAVLILLGWFQWRHRQIHPSTDNAYIQGDVVTISSQVPGRLVEVRVAANDVVQEGDVIARIDPRDFEQALVRAQAKAAKAESALALRDAEIARAQAQAEAAKAEASLRKSDLQRFTELDRKGSAARRSYDEAVAADRVARAQVKSAEKTLVAARAGRAVDERELDSARAGVAAAKLQLEHCTIASPCSGVVAEAPAQGGAVVAPGQPLARVARLENGHVWIEANFKETQLQRIRPGQSARVRVDTDQDFEFEGRVESLGAGSGAVFSLLPPENATGNWVKVVQRVPVRIAIDFDRLPESCRRLGLSCDVEVDTRSGERAR